MGITGFYPLIKGECKGTEYISPCKLKDFEGKVIAVDAPNFMYRLGGDQPGYLERWGQLHIDFVRNRIKPLYVFDGKAPAAKQAVIDARNKIRNEHLAEMKLMEDTLKKKKLEEGLILPSGDPSPKKPASLTPEKQHELKDLEQKLKEFSTKVTHVYPETIANVKRLLKAMGATVVQAHSEGEATCAFMNKIGMADAVMAEDADVVAFGAKRLIRGVGGFYNREVKMEVYDIEKILEKMGLDIDQVVDIAILSGCDFSSKIPSIACPTALKKIREHFCIENVILSLPEKIQSKIPEDFNYIVARKIFYSYAYREEPFDYLLNLESTPYDHKAVCNALKGVQPFYRETAEPWAEAITGQKAQTDWYGEEEDEDGKKYVPKPVQPKSSFGSSNNNGNIHLPSSHPLGLPSKKNTKRKSPFAFSIPPPKKGFDEFIVREPKTD